MSVGSVMFLLCASVFNSSLALLWSSTIRCPNCFTASVDAFSVASLPSSTSAIPPCAAFVTNVSSAAMSGAAANPNISAAPAIICFVITSSNSRT